VADYGVTFETSAKTVIAFGTTVSNLTLTMPLNAPATVSLNIGHESNEMTAIYSQLAVGGVFCRVARGSQTVFFGPLSDMQVTLDDAGVTQASFTDLAGAYAGVNQYKQTAISTFDHYWTINRAFTYVIDQLLAAGAPLIALTRSGSPSGSIPTRGGVNQWMSSSDNVLDAIQELSGFANGIEWYVSPDNTFTVGDTLGTDKTTTVQFGYGRNTKGNVNGATVQYQPPRNNLYVAGSSGKITRSTYSSSSYLAYGEYCSTINYVPYTNQSDDDRAAARLRTKWRQVLDVTVEPTLAPVPLTDYFLGDTVSVNVQRDGLAIAATPRVNQIVINTDENLRETSHQITFEVL
jgi:hypothetical protein